MSTVEGGPQADGVTGAAGSPQSSAGFSHRDSGTPEDVWRDELDRRERAGTDALDLRGATALVVVAAHPDDETLGAAGLLHVAAAQGLPVTVVVATAGEASHPHSSTVKPEQLAARRRAETRAAVQDVAPEARVLFAGLPDGRVAESAGELERLLGPLIDAGTLVAAPWRGDRHPDHEAAGRVAHELASRAGARLLEYPIWLWHWGAPADLPPTALRALALDTAGRTAKRTALARHRSQTEPLSALPGDEALLHTDFLAHFDRDREIFIESAPPRTAPADTAGRLPSGPAAAAPDDAAGRFDAMLERDADPWGVETRWYERRKRAVLLAALPAERFDAVLELGCSTGVLSARLAERAASLLGVDVSARAVDSARRRAAGSDTARFAVASVPQDWPEGRFDLIVASELAYYLTAADRELLIERMRAALRPDGWIVVCHWRHPMTDAETTGDGATAEFADHPALEVQARHEEADFTLLVLARRPAVSVAAAEGIVP